MVQEKQLEATGDCEFCFWSIERDDHELCGHPDSNYFKRNIYDEIYAETNNCDLWAEIP
jgi:hypothetical protein